MTDLAGLASHRMAQFAELEAVLVPLVPALERLHDAQLEQRRVVVAGDLGALVVVNTAIEDTSARIALLEHRRQAIQTELEAELGVQGLRSVLTKAAIPPTDRTRLGQQVVQVARLVKTLREEGRKNAVLLDAASGAARRTRQVVERLRGSDSVYQPVSDPASDPAKARRLEAARRVRASLAGATPKTTPPVATGSQPGRAGEDVASSASEGAPRKEAP